MVPRSNIIFLKSYFFFHIFSIEKNVFFHEYFKRYWLDLRVLSSNRYFISNKTVTVLIVIAKL